MTIISHASSATLGILPLSYFLGLTISPVSHSVLVFHSPPVILQSVTLLHWWFQHVSFLSVFVSFVEIKKKTTQRIKEDGRDMPPPSQATRHPLYPIIISQSHSVTGSAVCCTDTSSELGVCSWKWASLLYISYKKYTSLCGGYI